MKILVLSLLRLGDIIMTVPALQGIQERYPDAEIHILINSQFRKISPLIVPLSKVWLFPREVLQQGLGEADRPIFESYDRLTELVDNLNGQEFDVVINLTHTRLSGWLASLLSAREKIGLEFGPNGRAQFGSKWIQFLNDQVELEGREAFHYSDLFCFAVGQVDPVLSGGLRETADGVREVEKFLIDSDIIGESFVVVQPLTSDEKKNWGITKYTAVIEQFGREHSDVPVVVLGASFERGSLEKMVSDLKSQGYRVHLGLLGLEGAFSLLKRASLLLTGDTSIKHLACSTSTPVLELSLGSSDLYRTGSYQHGSYIVQSREKCVPCVHSQPCSQKSHLCAQGIPVEVVSMLMREIFCRRSFQLKTIAEEYQDQIQVLEVDRRTSRAWAAFSLTDRFSEDNVGRWIDLLAKRTSLSSPASGRFDEQGMGSEIYNLFQLLKKIYSEVSDLEWKHLLHDFDQQLMFVSGRLNSLKVGLRILRGSYEDPRRLQEYVRSLMTIRDKIRHFSLLSSIKNMLDQVIEDERSAAFTRFRRMVDTVVEIERRVNLDLKIVRGLTSQIEQPVGVDHL